MKLQQFRLAVCPAVVTASILIVLATELAVAVPKNPPQTQPVPEKIGVVYYLDPVQKMLVPLAQERAAIKSNTRAFFRGATTQVELKGKNSSVRLSTGQAHEFFIRGVDPTRFKLYRFEVKGNQRELLMFRSGGLGNGQSVIDQSEISLSITECGQLCYKLTPTVMLGEGEYGFSPSDSNDTFSFSIVASSQRSPGAPKTVAGKATDNRILTNEDIVGLKQAGLGDEVIVAKVKSSPGKYRLETEDVVALKNQGISEAVILAMIEAAKNH